MKNMFTLKQLIFLCLGIIGMAGMSDRASAQTRCLTDPLQFGTFKFQHGGVSTLGPSPDYDSSKYFDQIIPSWASLTAGNFGYLGSGGWIKGWWTFQTPVDYLDKIVFYKNSRPLTHCVVLHWDGATWDTVLIRYRGLVSKFYDDSTHWEADSVEIVGCMTHAHGQSNMIPIQDNITPFVAIDTIMIADVQSIGGNPDFREIQFWRRVGSCTAPSEIVANTQGRPVEAGPGSPILQVCPGFSANLNATSNRTDTGHRYQWQISYDNTTWADIPGANGPGYEYLSLVDAHFRVVDTCSGGSYTISNVIDVVVDKKYAPYSSFGVAGYYMGFDNLWRNSNCLLAPYAGDVPNDLSVDNYWGNMPPYGMTTWRIDTADQGTSAWPNNANNDNAAKTATYPYNVAFTGNSYARIRTGNSSYPVGFSSKLDLFMDFTGVPDDKALYFYYLNNSVIAQDSLRVFLSTDEGVSFNLLGTYGRADVFTKNVLPISASGKSIIRFEGTRHVSGGSTDIGIDSIFLAPPCTGAPTAGKIDITNTYTAQVKPNIAVCPGSDLLLTTLGATMAGNLVYEWQETKDALTWTAVNGGTGSNSLFFTTPPIYDTVWYRLALKCGTTGTVVYSDTLKVNLTSPEPEYAALPYSQNFETWITKCALTDLPGKLGQPVNWAASPFKPNSPSNFNNQGWRADNFNSSTYWNLPSAGSYSATPSAGLARSARFHSHYVQIGQTGNLDLLFNGSGSMGPKELRFFYLNTGGSDSLTVFYSSDAGSNFTALGSYNIAAVWTQNTLQVPCNTPNCVIRFQGSGDILNGSDIGLDSVTVTPPCNSTPTAGQLLGPTEDPCAGTSFLLDLQGFSVGGGISFIWEKSTVDSTTGFTSVYPPNPIDTTKTYFTTSVNVPTWFRVIVRCVYTGQADTVIRFVRPAHFYYCYCTSNASVGPGADIGNVTIRQMPIGINVLNNGIGVPQNNNPTANKIYTDFRNPPSTMLPTPLHLDSSYYLSVAQINSAFFTPPGTTVTVWIDSNRNGVFDVNEIFLQENSLSTTLPSQIADTSFTIPSDMRVGITGMRVLMEQGTNVTSVPCGSYGSGETEDYLVEIRYHPCTGPASAGTVEISDTSACLNYPITLVDTTHEKNRYGLRWVWQYSPDSNSWSDIAGSLNRDTVVHIVTGQTYYRLMMVCITNFDTTYSNVVKVSLNPVYACYCFSAADGGKADSSDIGGMYLVGAAGEGIAIPVMVPHLQNPLAVDQHTDYTKIDTLHLYLDSMYQFMVFHTMKSKYHGDAKITLFMDFNNDLEYTITNNKYNELLWTGYSTSSYFTVIDSIQIPSYAIPGVLSGMRIILNNDVGPNPQSDSACGTYTSGETEDFVVMFHNSVFPYWPTGVDDVGNLSELSVYPNPTTGKFTVSFTAKQSVKEASIVVSNVAGQQMVAKQFYNPGRNLSEEIDVSKFARGVYIVEIKADNERQIRKLILR